MPLKVHRRSLPFAVDLAAVVDAVDGDTEGDVSFLLESQQPGVVGVTSSTLMTAASVRVEGRGHAVVLYALDANGERLLVDVARALASHVVSRDAVQLDLAFAAPSVELDDEQRLLAAGPLDVLRTLRAMLGNVGLPLFLQVNFEAYAAFDNSVGLRGDPDVQKPSVDDGADFVAFVPRQVLRCDGATTTVTSTSAADVRRALQLLETRPVAPEMRLSVAASPSVDVDVDDAEFAARVRRVQEHIVAGDVFQTVVSRTFSTPCTSPLAAYLALRASNPGPHHFFLRTSTTTLLGASPETAVNVAPSAEGLQMSVFPIAGTRRRGQSREEDERLESDLRTDPKEQAEHQMLVDLARNDVARLAVPGTRTVARHMQVERFARVMHLVSVVRGVLRPEFDALHTIPAAMFAGTLIGAPKPRAAELVAEIEQRRRGPYGGGIGVVLPDGGLDLAIVIRAALVREGVAYVQAGAGVVHDSDPLAEAQETQHKAAAVIDACAAVEVTSPARSVTPSKANMRGAA